MNINFIKLFIFDGELANDLTDSRKTKAKDALEALFQLYLLRDVQKAFEEYWLSYKNDVGATDEKALSRRKNRYLKLKERLSHLKSERDKLIERKRDLTQKVTELDTKYQHLLHAEERERGELDDITGRLNEAINIVNAKVTEIFEEIRDPHRISEMFCAGLVELKSHLDKLKLPRSTSKEFFYELASESNKECICGTILDEEKRRAIIEKSDEYLAEDDTGILNSIKSDIGQIANNTSSYYIEEMDKKIAELNSAIRLRDNLYAEKLALEKSLTESGSEELQEVKVKLPVASHGAS
jgi:DNA sulfur modification protein DndD